MNGSMAEEIGFAAAVCAMLQKIVFCLPCNNAKIRDSISVYSIWFKKLVEKVILSADAVL